MATLGGEKRIVFTGTPFWSDNLSRMVNRHASYLANARSAPARLPDLFKFASYVKDADAVVRVGFRPGIKSWKARLYDSAFHHLLGRDEAVEYLLYWIGSDVLYQTKDFHAGQLTRFSGLAQSMRNLVGAPWFVEELSSIGIQAESCLFPLDLPVSGVDRPAPLIQKQRKALTYVPDARPDFYGGKQMVDLARRHPDVEFDVIGGSGKWACDAPRNLIFHGWVPDIGCFLKDNPILIRLVPHDAIGGTVREALSYGCHVIYTYPIPHVHVVPFSDFTALDSIFSELILRDRKGVLGPNEKGARYAYVEWDPKRLTVALVTAILAGAGNHRESSDAEK